MLQVIGTAIALNLLIPQLPLVAGCALSILDVMIILFFYQPSGTMKGLRSFEVFVCILVMGVVVCFCIQLSLIKGTAVGDVFHGYLPSGAIVESEGFVCNRTCRVSSVLTGTIAYIKPAVSSAQQSCPTVYSLDQASYSHG